MKKAIIVMMSLMVLLQGCGMIIHGEMQDLSIKTDPPGVTARIGTDTCVTPCTMHVKRNSDNIYFTKGKLKDEFELNKTLNIGSSFCMNILWLVPGAVIDLIGGGAYTIQPVNVKLGEQ